ncbi:hypothetical protein C7M84_004545 [Penaeus vannamei]|uniref:Nuclear pore complex protein n=1 Tax=Penaeus vannamei TaxID=6689 RepID=A0A3R7MHR2_PENVA|nr:hypothetical protein C7M84_004545 [Penaeus vannamei]
MSGVQNALLEDSLARLDAALGSPGGGNENPKSPEDPTNRKQGWTGCHINGMSMIDSPSMIMEEVTAPPIHATLLGDATLDMTSAALLADDDPGVRATQVLFSEFINIMVANPSESQVWQELEQYQGVCAQQVESLAKLLRKAPRHHANFTRTQQVYQQLLSERNTWRLLGSLYMERMGEEENNRDSPMSGEEPTTDLTVVSRLYDTNRTIREAQIVIDWLEKNAADDFDRKFYDRSESSGVSIPFRGTRSLVTSLDPDAPVRQGKPLHDLDHEDEMRLMRCVFVYVRSGQVAAAEELCVKAGHHWRAATLEGWKLHHDPNPLNPSQRNPISGNPYRDVWKAVAWRAASDERLPQYERAIYGALCGHLQAVLGVCHEWQDVLWAYSRTMVDQWVEEQLRGAATHLRPLHPLPKDFPEEKLSMKALFEALRPEVQQQRHNNPGCKNILEACVKESIERGDVEQVAWYTSVLPVWLQVEWYARFLHNISDDHHRRHALQLAATVGLDTRAITSTVVTNIRLSGSRDPENEVVSETTGDDRVKISAIDWLLYDPKQRVEALRQANALLRTLLISRKIGTAKILFKKIPSDSVNVIIQEHETETGSRDLTTQSDNIVREYLCIRTFLDAQDSFTDWFDHYHQKRPQPPKKPTAGSNFSQQVAYEQAEQQHNGELDRWKHTLSLITKTACDRLYNVLLFPEGGWLVDSGLEDQDVDTSAKDTSSSRELRLDNQEPDRAQQMSVLRSIYIPQVTSLLQNILHSTENYKESVRLADIIASEQHQLYKAFGSCELQRFLIKLQETSRELLDRNCDALGYPLQ